jgi:hypothetical protein
VPDFHTTNEASDRLTQLRPMPSRDKQLGMSDLRTHRLKRAFLAGAIADGVAVPLMLVPQVSRAFFGVESLGGAYGFAMGYGASMMAGWTALLIWARQRPLERAFVAPLTAAAVLGLVVTEVVAFAAGVAPLAPVAAVWALQACLLWFFIGAWRTPGG